MQFSDKCFCGINETRNKEQGTRNEQELSSAGRKLPDWLSVRNPGGSYDYAKSFIFPDMSPAPAANMDGDYG